MAGRFADCIKNISILSLKNNTNNKNTPVRLSNQRLGYKSWQDKQGIMKKLKAMSRLYIFCRSTFAYFNGYRTEQVLVFNALFLLQRCKSKRPNKSGRHVRFFCVESTFEIGNVTEFSRVCQKEHLLISKTPKLGSYLSRMCVECTLLKTAIINRTHVYIWATEGVFPPRCHTL